MAKLALRTRWILSLALLLATHHASAQDSALFAQSAQAALARHWSAAAAPTVSWLLLDARTGSLLASRWPDRDIPLPLGSLTKPFVALAYARTHTAFPVITCHGTQGSPPFCWLPAGHGPLTIQNAIGYSCNAYFLSLAGETTQSALEAVAHDYFLPPPPASSTPAIRIGLSLGWNIAPTDLARAYVRLWMRPEAQPILAGMHVAAQRGTAKALHATDALAKTGTAPCLQHCIASGDGFVVLLTPSANPRLLLLVRKKGTTGSLTAATAALMLHDLQAGAQ
jgi:hypothetical protein